MLLVFTLASAAPPAPPHLLLGDGVPVYATATGSDPLAHVATSSPVYLEVALVGREGDRVQVTNTASAASCAGVTMPSGDGTVTGWVRAADLTPVVAAAAQGTGSEGSWAAFPGAPAGPATGGAAVIDDGVTVAAASIPVADTFPAGEPGTPGDYPHAGPFPAAHTTQVGDARVSFAADTRLTSAKVAADGRTATVGLVTACGYVWASVPARWLGGGRAAGSSLAPAPPVPNPPPARPRLRAGTPLYWAGGTPAGVLTRDHDVGTLTEDGERRCWTEPALFAAASDAPGADAQLCVAATDLPKAAKR